VPVKHIAKGKLEGGVEVTGRWGESHKELLNNLNGQVTGIWKTAQCGEWALEQAMDPL
jgi:hypothetical protein